MLDKTDIRDSFYSDIFEEVDRGKIFQLSIQRSEQIWSEYIDKKAKNYFYLPNESWLVNSQERIIARWFDDYNNMIYDRVANELFKAVPWADDDEIWFCINSSTILECSWVNFRFNWGNFLCSHDDAPIIIHPKWKSCGLVFYISDVAVIGDCTAH